MPNELDDLRELWAAGKSFLMQMEVGSPFPGCFYELNLFLVTPPGCEEYHEPSVVLPLYASGQGVAMDAVHSLDELIGVCEAESVQDLGHKSKLLKTSAYGRISLVAVAPMGPINDVLPAGERYWMRALSVAEEQWGVELTWRCEKCNQVITYDEYEGRPEATGYHGDGGIGVHYTGVMCSECISAGTCDRCNERGCSAMDAYDAGVAEHGWSLCPWCTEELLKGCGLKIPDGLELGTSVDLCWYPPEPTENRELAFFISGGPRRSTADADAPPVRLPIEFDADALVKNAKQMHIENLHPKYGYGVSLSGEAVSRSEE